jgi:hypothetical protein
LLRYAQAKRELGGVGAPNQEKGPPVHVFTSPELLARLQGSVHLDAAAAASADFAAGAMSVVAPDANFLTAQDVQALVVPLALARGDASRGAVDVLRRQDCEIERVERRISLREFLSKYRHTPVILSARTRVGTLPFPSRRSWSRSTSRRTR